MRPSSTEREWTVNWNTFTDMSVSFPRVDSSVDMAKLNKLRAWARRNRCRIDSSRYARDAYEGKIVIPMRDGTDGQNRLVREARELVQTI